MSSLRERAGQILRLNDPCIRCRLAIAGQACAGIAKKEKHHPASRLAFEDLSSAALRHSARRAEDKLAWRTRAATIFHVIDGCAKTKPSTLQLFSSCEFAAGALFKVAVTCFRHSKNAKFEKIARDYFAFQFCVAIELVKDAFETKNVEDWITQTMRFCAKLNDFVQSVERK